MEDPTPPLVTLEEEQAAVAAASPAADASSSAGLASPTSAAATPRRADWKSNHENDAKSKYGHRDVVGYGAVPVKPHWPRSAKVALNFVINYEEGSEMCTLHGDASSEHLLSDIPGAKPMGERTGCLHPAIWCGSDWIWSLFSTKLCSPLPSLFSTKLYSPLPARLFACLLASR